MERRFPRAGAHRVQQSEEPKKDPDRSMGALSDRQFRFAGGVFALLRSLAQEHRQRHHERAADSLLHRKRAAGKGMAIRKRLAAARSQARGLLFAARTRTRRK